MNRADFSVGDVLCDEPLEKEFAAETVTIRQTKHRIIREAYELFSTHFGATPLNELHSSIAPARVNLIGEHIDYCDGFVLPMAIPLYTVIIGKKKQEGCKLTRIYSSAYNKTSELHLPYQQDHEDYPKWISYIRGVLALHNCDASFDAVVHSAIPLGSGLSSSAALELSTSLFVSQIYPNASISSVERALLCQNAEHQYAHVPCGIMDQFVIALAQFPCALKIDCKSLDYDLIPIDFSQDAVFVVINSGVKHTHSEGEYGKRRHNVEKALTLMDCKSWRDVTRELIKTKENILKDFPDMTDNSYHVVEEIERTVKAAEALLDNNIVMFGKLMTESHVSLRDKYKVSCVEIDELVRLSLEVKGVFGSRMTGGGFGGCTVTLVRKENVSNLENYIKENYKYATPITFACEPVKGAEVADLNFLS
ncbi:unnamed protein product [Auanema sp. JU1783]|nr:unnamed protein product [Auanema sp. JU1783]